MKLMNFISEILDAAVDSLTSCSNDNEERAKEQLLAIAKKIQTELPGTETKRDPWPGQGQT